MGAMSIRLSDDEVQRLETLAARTGRSKTFYVREAVHEHLGDLEERYWADDVIERWEASDRSTRPASELWAELDA
ncbi:type II toxin-antitoxin system VapB family antitoxin [Subtercola vilae]|nr:ribbon-helix-helix protein, CopG family [Subtercola vilae]